MCGARHAVGGMTRLPPDVGRRVALVAILPYASGMATDLKTLYRPVGEREFQLIKAGGFRAFPPRLPDQPFFYPVLTEEYATKIARDWNTKDENSVFVGYVLRFAVHTEALNRYELRIVGSSEHREYWIPAGDLTKFNANIVGQVEVVSEFRGKRAQPLEN